MKRILINFAHPAITRSRIHRALLADIFTAPPEVQEYITINDLYDKYPDFHINVVREKKLLLAHDVIIFQYPLNWFTAPAIITEWQYTVLEQGFAYGEQGNALEGRVVQHIVSTPEAENSFQENGANKVPLPEYMRSYQQTANICSMEYLPPLCFYDNANLNDEQIKACAETYKTHILHLITGK